MSDPDFEFNFQHFELNKHGKQSISWHEFHLQKIILAGIKLTRPASVPVLTFPFSFSSAYSQ